MTTATDLIHSSMRLLGAIAAGETLESQELADALITLNQMLASWSDERLTVYQIRVDTTPLTSGTANYTMGPSGFGQRPTQVVAARAYTASYGRSLTLIDVNRWTDILERGGAINLPMKAFVDYSFPLATVLLWPQPLTGTLIELYTMQEYTTFPEGAGPNPTHNFQPMRLQYTTTGPAKFTVGAGGDVPSPRPARCDAIAASVNGYRRMVELVPSAEWSALLEPSGAPITVPLELYVEYGYPAATLHVWPNPGAAGSLDVHSLQPLPQIANATDNIDLPPGY